MRCVCSSRVIPFSKRTKKLCAYKRYNYIVLSARFWMTANPATACAVLVRVFTDTLNVACLRGLNPFLPTLRGAPVTIEPHMQNASAFPCPVQSNQTTRDNSVIARGKAVFHNCSCCSRRILSAALYRGTAANAKPVRPLPRAAA